MRDIFGIRVSGSEIEKTNNPKYIYNKEHNVRYFRFLENIITNITEPAEYFTYFDDFAVYPIDEWIITADNINGNASREIADEINGVLTITNDDDKVGDCTNMQLPTMFAINEDKPLYFEAKIKVSDDTNTDWFIGLADRDTDVIDAVSNCICFKSDNGDANVDFKMIKAAGSSTDEDSDEDITGNEWITLSFIWDGMETVHYYINKEKIGTATTGIPDSVNLALTIAIKNGTSDNHSISIDYTKIMQKR